MRSFSTAFCCFAAFALVNIASLAQGRSWYYCAATHRFYPYTQRCPVPWRVVKPYRPVPLVGAPRNLLPPAEPQQQPAPVQTTAPPAQDTAPPTPEPDVQAQALAVAQAHAQAQANRAAYQQRRAIEKAKSKGYELIPSVKDLILDGKELAARDAKIQITGIYTRIGDNAAELYGSEDDVFADDDIHFPILTDDAQRALREALMDYRCATQLGCEVNVGGHVTMCQHLGAAMADYPPMPCFNIEVAIIYRPGD